MEPQTRALPMSDLDAIFDVLSIVHGYLLEDELAPDLVRRLLSSLADDGLLPEGASAGELNALLADLGQRLHWAMSVGETYPEPLPRRTIYYLDVPDEGVEACVAELTALGGDVGRPEAEAGVPSLGGQIAAAFPDLPPDPSHHARVAQLSALADRYGGQLNGFGG
ncbi:hypothetical protein [Actinoplanes sp. NPDC049316]|uniref:hypothetical protein n=1 Tax=Actinoplanes sp. NPDC049316 TaxID=3154727 RepID=UPI003440D2F0